MAAAQESILANLENNLNDTILKEINARVKLEVNAYEILNRQILKNIKSKAILETQNQNDPAVANQLHQLTSQLADDTKTFLDATQTVEINGQAAGSLASKIVEEIFAAQPVAAIKTPALIKLEETAIKTKGNIQITAAYVQTMLDNQFRLNNIRNKRTTDSVKNFVAELTVKTKAVI